MNILRVLTVLVVLAPLSYGNISRMAHELAHDNADFTQYRDMTYAYDQLNRLTNADDIEQDYFDEIFEYDAQGRMTVQRRDTSIAKNVGGEYSYYANTNRLKSVANGMGGTADGRIMSDANNFVYDSEGNLVEDKSKKMKITYDWRGMPVEFVRELENGDSLKLVMKYDGSGKRISKTRLLKIANATEWSDELTTHYTGIGTEIRTNNSGNAAETKVVINMPQGLGRYAVEYADVNDSANAGFEWYLKNHLGSTKAVYRTTGTTAGPPMLQRAYDYRSYGEKINLTELTDKVTESFTGKELDDETELGYWGARYLDLMLGLWVSADPKRQFNSPYLYAGNIPNLAVDADGSEAKVMKHGNDMIIIIPVAFSGNASTDKNIREISNAVEKHLSGQFGQYSVSTIVVQEQMGSGVNMIELLKMGGRSRAFPEESRATIMMGNDENDYYSAVHEFAHLIGMDDRYKDEGSKSIPDEDFEDNLMGSYGQFGIKPSQIEEILYGPESKYNQIDDY